MMTLTLVTAALLAAETPLSMRNALERALRVLPEVEVERVNVAQSSALIRAARGAFDPLLKGSATWQDAAAPASNPFESTTGVLAQRTRTQGVAIGQNLPWRGIRWEAGFQNQRLKSNNPYLILNPLQAPQLRLSLTVPLGRGAAIDEARAQLRVQHANRKVNEAQLEAAVAQTIARVERAYWTLAAQREAVRRFSSLVETADQSLASTNRLIDAGQLPQADAAGARGRLAQAKDALETARGLEREAEFALKELIARDPQDALWTDPLQLTDAQPLDPQSVMPASDMVTEAVRNRVEIRLAELRLAPARIERQLAAEARKPAVDVQLGGNSLGLAGREVIFPDGLFGVDLRVPRGLVGNFGDAFSQAARLRYPTWQAGVNIELPVGNRAAAGREAAAGLAVRAAELERERWKRQVAREVHQAIAMREAAIARQAASNEAVTQAQARLESELRLMANGKSTNLSINIRQSELAEAQQSLVNAQRDYWLAIAELRRAAGQGLKDYGITVN
jgi:outer membrane protein TolC